MSKKNAPEKSVPQQNKIVLARSLEASFSGPLPHPDILAGYNRVVPDAAERILCMAEKAQKHRHEVELDQHRRVEKLITRGQWLSFVTAIFVFSVGSFLVYLGKSVEGMTTMIATLAVFVAVYFNKMKDSSGGNGVDDPNQNR
jgi:uncharacterized membrane protein